MDGTKWCSVENLVVSWAHTLVTCMFPVITVPQLGEVLCAYFLCQKDVCSGVEVFMKLIIKDMKRNWWSSSVHVVLGDWLLRWQDLASSPENSNSFTHPCFWTITSESKSCLALIQDRYDPTFLFWGLGNRHVDYALIPINGKMNFSPLWTYFLIFSKWEALSDT